MLRPLPLLSLSLLLLLAACSGGGTQEVQLGSDGAANLDQIARNIAISYRKTCYEPIRKRKVPDDICQFRLFETAERQFGSSFSPVELDAVANRIMGDEIEKALLRVLVYDKPSQRYINQSFLTRAQIVGGLKEKYKIR